MSVLSGYCEEMRELIKSEGNSVIMSANPEMRVRLRTVYQNQGNPLLKEFIDLHDKLDRCRLIAKHLNREGSDPPYQCEDSGDRESAFWTVRLFR